MLVNAIDNNECTPLLLSYSVQIGEAIMLHKPIPSINMEPSSKVEYALNFSIAFAFHHAANARRHSDINHLVKACDEATLRFELNRLNNDGLAPLHIAIKNGPQYEPIMVGLLLTPAVDSNAWDGRGRTPLMIAIEEYPAAIKDLLMTRGLDVNARGKNGATPLNMAIVSNQNKMDVVRQLMDHPDIDVNARDGAGWMPLHNAVDMPLREAVEALLDRNDININCVTLDDLQNTSLHLAIFHDDIVEILLSCGGIDYNVQNSAGFTPLHRAAQFGRLESLKLLLGITSINPNIKNRKGRSPLFVAVLSDFVECVEELLNREDVHANLIDCYGFSPLHVAVQNGHISIVKMLLGQKNIDVRVCDNLGQTVWHNLCDASYECEEQTKYETASLLLNHPASLEVIDFEDDYGDTPYFVARANGYQSLVQLIDHQKSCAVQKDRSDGQTYERDHKTV